MNRKEKKKKSKTVAPFYTKVQFVERTLKNNPFNFVLTSHCQFLSISLSECALMPSESLRLSGTFPQSGGVALFFIFCCFYFLNSAAAHMETPGGAVTTEEEREGGVDGSICLNKNGIFIPS